MSPGPSRPQRRAAARRAAATTVASVPAPDATVALRRVAGTLLAFLLLAAAFHAATEAVVGSDFWFALAAGRWISAHRAVPAVDVFSYTYGGAPWTNQEWGAQVLFYQTFHLLGGDGVVWLKIALVVVIFLLAAWIGWRRSGSSVLAIGSAAVAALVCRPFLDVRPQLFTLIGTLLVLAATDAYRRRPRVAPLLALPALLFVWVNLHYGFIFGLGVAGLIAGVEVLKALFPVVDGALTPRRALALLAAALGAVVVCVANPQYLRALTFPFTILDPASPWQDVLEWQPVELFTDGPLNPALFGWVLLAQALALGAALWAAPRRVDVTAMALAAVTAAMALRARRFIPLCTLVGTPLLATNLALVFERLVGRVPDLRTRRTALAAAALALAGGAALVVTEVRSFPETFGEGLFSGMIDAEFFPRNAAEFLRRNPQPSRLYNLYNWGGYLMWNVPDRPVFIDGRAHAVYPPAFYRENYTVHFAEQGWEQVLDRWGVDLVVWPASEAAEGTDLADIIEALDASVDWTLIYDDGQAAVFAHVTRGRAWVDAFEDETLVYPGGVGRPGERPSAGSGDGEE
jgi:hypothetical protein